VSARRQRREAAEAAALAGLRGAEGWLCAIELARQVAWPWRSVARALLRLAAEGRVRQAARVWVSTAHRRRVTRIYRLAEDSRLAWECWPSWAMPHVPLLPGTQM